MRKLRKQQVLEFLRDNYGSYVECWSDIGLSTGLGNCIFLRFMNGYALDALIHGQAFNALVKGGFIIRDTRKFDYRYSVWRLAGD